MANTLVCFAKLYLKRLVLRHIEDITPYDTSQTHRTSTNHALPANKMRIMPKLTHSTCPYIHCKASAHCN